MKKDNNKISKNIKIVNNKYIYEAISNLKDEGFWGLRKSLINDLFDTKKRFEIRFIWTNNGGIVFKDTEIKALLKGRRLSKNNDYKFHSNELLQKYIKKWNNSLIPIEKNKKG